MVDALGGFERFPGEGEGEWESAITDTDSGDGHLRALSAYFKTSPVMGATDTQPEYLD